MCSPQGSWLSSLTLQGASGCDHSDRHRVDRHHDAGDRRHADRLRRFGLRGLAAGRRAATPAAGARADAVRHHAAAQRAARAIGTRPGLPVHAQRERAPGRGRADEHPGHSQDARPDPRRRQSRCSRSAAGSASSPAQRSSRGVARRAGRPTRRSNLDALADAAAPGHGQTDARRRPRRRRPRDKASQHAQLQTAFPRTLDMPSILLQVQRLATQSNVSLESFAPSLPTPMSAATTRTDRRHRERPLPRHPAVRPRAAHPGRRRRTAASTRPGGCSPSRASDLTRRDRRPARADRDDRDRRVRLQRRRPADRAGPPGDADHHHVRRDLVMSTVTKSWAPTKSNPAAAAPRKKIILLGVLAVLLVADPRLRGAAPDASLLRAVAAPSAAATADDLDRARHRPGRRREPDRRRRRRDVRADDRLGRRRDRDRSTPAATGTATPVTTPAESRRGRARAPRTRPAKDPFVPLLGQHETAPHGASTDGREHAAVDPSSRRPTATPRRQHEPTPVDGRRRPRASTTPVSRRRPRPTTHDRHEGRARHEARTPPRRAARRRAGGRPDRRRRQHRRQEAGRRRGPVLQDRQPLVPARRARRRRR